MKHTDIKAMMAQVAPVIREYAAAALSPVVARLDAIERQIGAMPAPLTHDDAKLVILAEIKSVSDALPAMVAAEVEKAAAAIPEPPALPDIPAMVNEAVAAIPPAPDGKSVTVEDVRPLLDELVSTAFSALPVPNDGEPGKDGLDAVEFLRGADGHLIVTMSNGTTRDLGQVNGKDGAPGRDGFGFDDMTAEYDGERTVTLVFAKGDHVERFPFVLPIVLDKGVFKDGKTYAKGDAVSYGGSIWIAQEETGDKPDGGKDWRLAVKRGRDGKDGTVKPAPEPKPLKVG
jgi:hypothetical protein